MSEPFLAEIRMVGFNFAPRGWAFCDGQIMPINQNQALYSLLGTTYGGDGRTSFGLPDLRGRTPMHVGAGHGQGQKSGAEKVTLAAAQMIQHTHQAKASNDNASVTAPANNALGRALNAYASPGTLVQLRAGTVANTGGGQEHENMQPYLTVSFCIALKGLFPSRN